MKVPKKELKALRSVLDLAEKSLDNEHFIKSNRVKILTQRKNEIKEKYITLQRSITRHIKELQSDAGTQPDATGR